MKARILGLAAWYSKLLNESQTPQEAGRRLVGYYMKDMKMKSVPNHRVKSGTLHIVVHPDNLKKLKLAAELPTTFKDIFYGSEKDPSFEKQVSDSLVILTLIEHCGLLQRVTMQSNPGQALFEKIFGKHQVDLARADAAIDAYLTAIEALMKMEQKKGKEADGKKEGESAAEETDESGDDDDEEYIAGL